MTRLTATIGLLLHLIGLAVASPSLAPTGTLTGVVREERSGRPIAGATVQYAGMTATTDSVGEFRFEGVPVGVHDVEVTAEGYERTVLPNIALSAGRVVRLEVDLIRADRPVTELGGIRVRAQRFQRDPRAPTSTYRMNRLEMQRAVGAAWDIQRIFASQPGVTTTSDMTNNIIVRGGNPSENGIFVDHIPMPSISHLSWQGETGGAIGIVNLDFVRDAEFYTGGFPASFGGKLSSILDIRFREGNRERLGGEVELSMAGFGGGIEGPLMDGKGSWVVSYRKSFLDLLKEPARLETVPQYEDAHAKVVVDLSPTQRLSLVGIGSRDNIDIQWVRDTDRAVYRGSKFAVGANWYAVLGSRAAARVTLADTTSDSTVDVWQVLEDPVYRNNSTERETTLEGVLDLGESVRRAWQFGAMARLVDFRHRIDSEAWRGFSENEGRVVWLGAQRLDATHRAFKFAAFAHRDLTLREDLSLKLGLRLRHFTLTKATNAGPRFGLEWRVASNTTVTLSGGLYHQSPTYIELTLDERNLDLSDGEARHLIAGVEHRFTETSRVRLEVYGKDYRNLPVFGDMGKLAPSGRMSNSGRKRVRGIDFLLEKRLQRGPYGSIILSVSDSKAKEGDGPWYADDFDVRRIVAVSGGIPITEALTVSGKWRFVGGRPFTQFPVVKKGPRSYELVPDFTKRNQVRYPDYHRLDLRIDRRLDFSGWGASLFIEMQNVYGRENVFARQFLPRSGTFKDVLQFKRLLVIGLIADF